MSHSDRSQLFARRLRPGQLIAIDVVIAMVVAGVVVGNLLATPRRLPPGWPDGLAWVIGVVLAMPIALRRRWPIGSLVLGLVVLDGTILAGNVLAGPAAVVVAGALYLVAARRSVYPAIGALAGALAAALAGCLTLSGDAGLSAMAFCTAAFTIGWLLGRWVSERLAFQRHAAAQQARQAVAEERMRIARELHDVVAHNMSLVAVKAGVANHVAKENPGEVRAALEVIEATSREALAEMRRLLGVLRTDGDGDLDLEPAPGLVGLPALVRRTAQTGLRIDLRLPEISGLPECIELSAYRIVQESLTNMVKHAAPANGRITLAVVADSLHIDVLDDGPGTGMVAESAGHGLIGMRERVLTYGGSFQAGPRPEGGFAVSARIPLPGRQTGA